MKAALLVLVVTAMLAGCVVVRNGGATTTGARVSYTTGDRVVVGVLVAMMVADGLEYYVRSDDGSMTRIDGVPEFDPSRRVSEQDCTRPIDPEQGNLRCR